MLLAVWTHANGSSSVEAVFDENNFTRYRTDAFKYAFEGFIEWRCIKVSDPRFGAEGALAAEKVRGFLYDDDDSVDIERRFHFIAIGYRVVEPENTVVIGNDGYDICMHPKAPKVTTMYCMGHALKWGNPMVMTRVATRDELIALLKERFGGIGDLVKIISDLLHYFEYPGTERVNEWVVKRKMKKMKEREPRIQELFSDLEYLSDDGTDVK